jgi:hypothetical protein
MQVVTFETMLENKRDAFVENVKNCDTKIGSGK